MSSLTLKISLNKIEFQIFNNDKATLTIDILMIRQTQTKKLANIMLLQTSVLNFFLNIIKMSYFKQNANPSNRVGMEGVFLGLAGLFLGISLGLRLRETPQNSPANPRKTPSIPPLLLGLTQYPHIYSAPKLCQMGQAIFITYPPSNSSDIL